jgi:uncharacterized protein (TIGR02646 family)
VIRIPDRPLPVELQHILDEHQARIDGLPDYAERVEAAAIGWNRAARVMPKVREILLGMCSGEDRCMYCEDSVAHQIDHFRPKNLYPEHTFTWQNYVFSCGVCNGIGCKGSRFAVLSSRSRRYVELKHTRDVPLVVPDAAKTAMLIDPRREDPMRFMILDLIFPFHFHPRHGRGCVARARASYTIEVLGLNRREKLIRRRENAYLEYVRKLKEYTAEHEPAKRERCKFRVLRGDHVTVWREMQRQHPHIEELRRLFEQAPEALHW